MSSEAETHAELEAVDRDIKAINVRLEWLERYHAEWLALTARRDELEKTLRKLRKG